MMHMLARVEHQGVRNLLLQAMCSKSMRHKFPYENDLPVYLRCLCQCNLTSSAQCAVTAECPIFMPFALRELITVIIARAPNARATRNACSVCRHSRVAQLHVRGFTSCEHHLI